MAQARRGGAGGPRRATNCAAAVLAASLLLALADLLAAGTAGAAVNTLPPAHPVKLVFVHHSTGEAWLSDSHGGLGLALRANDYFVGDTNYGWGDGALPASRGEPIGSTTDLGDWWTWFRGPDSAAYQTALSAWSGQMCGYSRLATDPGGPNEIVMFKSCFPNSDLSGDPGALVPAIGDDPLKGQAAGGDAFTVANAKGVYLDLLSYFAAHQETLFVAIVAPPVQHPGTPANGRAMADWLVDHWLDGYPHHNVFVWDYYTVLTSNRSGGAASDVGLAAGNHHRIWNGAVQHVTTDGADHLVYDSGGDDHPSRAGDLKATAEFVPMLNDAYNIWKGNGGGDTTPPRTYAPRAAKVTRGKRATLAYRVADPQSASVTVTIRVRRTASGAPAKTLDLGLKPTGVDLRASFVCKLARGRYTFTVEARDSAGLAQSLAGVNSLRVY